MTAGADGPTYRQLDHWTRLGLLRTEHDVPGSGHPREWQRSELRVSRLMVRLLNAGLDLRRAHDVARSTEPAAGTPVGGVQLEIGPGIWVLVGCKWE